MHSFNGNLTLKVVAIYLHKGEKLKLVKIMFVRRAPESSFCGLDNGLFGNICLVIIKG